MKPRTIIIIGIAAIILIAAAIYFLASRGGGPLGNSSGNNGGGEVTLPASQVLSGISTGTTLTIGTASGQVHVNNFYLSDPMVTDGGKTVILASTSDYSITYDTIDSSFWIGIAPDRFVAARPAAEQALTAILNASTTDICKLNITMGTFYSATSTLNGVSYGLSACPNLNSTP